MSGAQVPVRVVRSLVDIKSSLDCIELLKAQRLCDDEQAKMDYLLANMKVRKSRKDRANEGGKSGESGGNWHISSRRTGERHPEKANCQAFQPRPRGDS